MGRSSLHMNNIQHISIEQLLHSNDQDFKDTRDDFHPNDIIEEDDWDDKIYLAEYAVETPKRFSIF